MNLPLPYKIKQSLILMYIYKSFLYDYDIPGLTQKWLMRALAKYDRVYQEGISMLSPVNIVNNLVVAVPQLAGFTPGAWLLKGLSVLHLGSWIYRQQQVYSNPDNWVYLAAGHVTNQFIGDGKIKCCLQLYSIVIRINRISQEFALLKEAIREVGESFKGYYPYVSEYKWTKTPGLNAQMAVEWTNYTNKIKEQSIRIAQSIRNVLIKILEISSRLFDAYDAFYMKNNPLIILEGVEGLKEIAKQRKEILEMLDSHKVTMDSLIKYLQLPITSKGVIDTITTGLNGVDLTVSTLDSASQNEFVVNVGKAVVYHTAFKFGLENFVPSWLTPTKKLV